MASPPPPPPPRKDWPRHLFLRGRRYYARLRVPDSVGQVGTHLQRSLETDRYAEAVKRLPVVLSALRLDLEKMRAAKPDASPKAPPPTVDREAAWWREQIMQAGGDPDSGRIPDELDDQWARAIEEKLGPIIGEQPDEHGRPEAIYAGEAEARRLADLVFGKVLPVEDQLERFIREKGLKRRYADRHRRAARRLREWLVATINTDDLRRVTRRLAGDFYDHLLATGTATPTANSLVGSLGVYWKWLGVRLGVEGNPWAGQARKPKATEALAEKRPFTDDEMVKLLTGETYRTLHDLMRVAALSGMRIDEIARLTVETSREEVFRITEGKTANSIREVPIHPALNAIVARRQKGKAPGTRLFDELKASGSRELSAKASERFTEYRRRIGVDERREGQRQANIDFHSFRRWFTTKAEQAGQPPHLISAEPVI